MLILRSVLILIAMGISYSAAYAGSKKLAEELVALESTHHGKDMLVNAFKKSMEACDQATFGRLTEGKKIAPEDLVKITHYRELYKQKMAETCEEIGVSYMKKLQATTIEFYAQNFTDQELKQMIAYQKLPVHKKLENLWPEISNIGAQVVQNMAKEFEEKFIKKVKEVEPNADEEVNRLTDKIWQENAEPAQ